MVNESTRNINVINHIRRLDMAVIFNFNTVPLLSIYVYHNTKLIYKISIQRLAILLSGNVSRTLSAS